MPTTESLPPQRPEDNADLSSSIDSVAIARLIEEVRSGDPIDAANYNRTYNRHNR
jgi:hypothetical protein